MSTYSHIEQNVPDVSARKQAVIDVGSNSVRLVIYAGPPRIPVTLFNEKVLCGLGSVEPETRNLRRDAMDNTLRVLKRFRTLINEQQPMPVTVFATAAMRDAPNGPAFVAEIRDLGFRPIILSGQEEARLAALGVLSSTPDAVLKNDPACPNLCGDMGGGSLELTRFSTTLEDPLADRVSLPLGPLRLMSEFGPNLVDAEPFIVECLNAQDWIKDKRTDLLYSVGGAWRAIAKVYMAKEGYGLSVLDHFEIDHDEVITICDLLTHQSSGSIVGIPGVQRKRVNTLPHAALVLKHVLKLTHARKVVISSAGVREGVLYDQLTPEVRTENPLLALARDYARRFSPDPSFGEAMIDFTAPLFPDETDTENLIRRAVCTMCDLAAMHHPDMRAIHASDIVLHSPLTGVDHVGRLAISAAMYVRYRGKMSPWPDHIPEALLPEEMLQKAIILGMALRFAADLSANSVNIIKQCALYFNEGRITVRLPDYMDGMMGDTPTKRLTALADQLSVEKSVLLL